jgi:hypothetical protein
LPGGVKSGFVHVDPDSEEKRLFQVKGKRNIKVKQVINDRQTDKQTPNAKKQNYKDREYDGETDRHT